MQTNYPAIEGLDDATRARIMLYQSGQLVHAPALGVGLARQRTITGTSNQVTVTNGDGVSGDPTISLPTQIAGLQGISLNAANTDFLEIGRVDGVASTPFVDFHSGATFVDFDSRIIASGGTGVSGGGQLDLDASVVSLPSGRLKFPSTQNASADANTMDDFERATWSPVVQGDATAGVGTYSLQTGRYLKIGPYCWVSFELWVTAHTGTGSMVIAGLPFAVDTVSMPFAAEPHTVALTAGNYLTLLAIAGGGTILVRQVPTGGGAIAGVPIDTDFVLRGQGFYMAAT